MVRTVGPIVRLIRDGKEVAQVRSDVEVDNRKIIIISWAAFDEEQDGDEYLVQGSLKGETDG